jgi:diguanylate cyclase (GGDEF)-like protein
VPCRDSDGRILAIISLGEPVSGMRATEDELDFLVAIGRHAALALEQAHRTRESSRHRAALEQLLTLSRELAEKDSIEAVAQAVCEGVRQALGFRKVVLELNDGDSGMVTARAFVGWTAGEGPRGERTARVTEPLMVPEFEIGGCYLLSYDDAVARVGHGEFGSTERNGRGPRAWDRHRLFVPLHDATGAVVGRIWADEPEDRLLPSRSRLEALALFAGQAEMAIVSAQQMEALRVLAEQDPLTGLPNRRAFMRDLENEVERARRYGHPLTLAIGDVDRFKQINDTLGHPAGDRALCAVAETLRAGLRSNDGAFRLGGDEFALLLPETAREDAIEVVRRLDTAFRASAPERFTDLQMSVGVATLHDEEIDAESLIRQADAALYEHKRRRTEPRDALAA